MEATVSKWSRRYVAVSASALVCWQLAMLTGVPRRTEVVLGVFGFVLQMVFGKAYALVPAYFERELAFPKAPGAQFPLVVVGAAGLAAASLGVGPPGTAAGAAILWCLGVAIFVATLLATIARPLLCGATGTGRHNAERRSVDRLANGFVPVALLYLLVGSYETAAVYGPFPALLGGPPARASHLLAAGTAALLVFALGFRLLPRFLSAHPPAWTARIVLPSGAAAPALIAVGVGGRRFLMAGAMLEAVAVCLFAATVGGMFVRSSRRRVGGYGIVVGVASGVGGVLLGLSFAFGAATGSLTTLHLRLNVLGFLGLVIVGLAYHFYPPSIGELPGSSDRTAFASILGVWLGLSAHTVAVFGGLQRLDTAGTVLTLAGATVYAYLLASAFLSRG